MEKREEPEFVYKFLQRFGIEEFSFFPIRVRSAEEAIRKEKIFIEVLNPSLNTSLKPKIKRIPFLQQPTNDEISSLHSAMMKKEKRKRKRKKEIPSNFLPPSLSNDHLKKVKVKVHMAFYGKASWQKP
jgi:hypothetical protein